MISHKLKFLFIHIPKTSGNSLSLFLKDYINNIVIQRKSNLGENQGISIICEKTGKDIKHENINYYEKLYGNLISEYFKFTIVRNPYDRILSFYFWNKGIKNQIFNRLEFIDFIKENNSYQHNYINNGFHIIYYENLINDLKNINIFKNIVNFDHYPSLNVSINQKLNYDEILDKDLKDLIYQKFKKDFELFNYSR